MQSAVTAIVSEGSTRAKCASSPSGEKYNHQRTLSQRNRRFSLSLGVGSKWHLECGGNLVRKNNALGLIRELPVRNDIC